MIEMFFHPVLRHSKTVYEQLRAYSSALPSIYALTSGTNQPCGIAVVRLSGSKCLEVIGKMTKNLSSIEPAKMYYKNIYHPKTNVKIDKGLIVWFKGSSVENHVFLNGWRVFCLKRSKKFHRWRCLWIPCPWRSCNFSFIDWCSIHVHGHANCRTRWILQKVFIFVVETGFNQENSQYVDLS